MSKVSIGLRGWRFDEEAVFTDDGEFRPLEEMPLDTKQRLVRLQDIVDGPCDACWLEHGEDSPEEYNPSEVVYGEPLSEVLLCGEHENDLVYWFREAGGSQYAETEEFDDAFHEWFLDGGRAPEGYEGVDHVATEPDELPDPPAMDDDERKAEWEVTEKTDLRDLDQEYPGADE